MKRGVEIAWARDRDVEIIPGPPCRTGDSFVSIFPNGKRERGLIAYLQGLTYRVTMRVAHRFNWHYAPPIYPDGYTQLWCKWCGFRQTIKTRPSLREMAVALGCDMESTQVPPEIMRAIRRREGGGT